ncbi:MBL fold metallo-hydrolase [Zwartia panacis]|uniref:MBL fold metallo-hydrolase n=1 Tax=Zwartia panacis TaxID=2683345 RepID=UPI0025B34A0C|nr:MBL fold metallo-hydrolase [Zwartia panacis]MDN4016782.1 MBL fold metallo-hydrolase [Zwartia panacis]
MKLTFLGAASTVTGSKTLLSTANHQVLIDCGLFQGYKNLRALNWTAFPFDPKKLDAVVLTHAHLDHSGALPLLVKQGFHGPIYATSSTIDLCKILLLDSAKLQQEEADFANRHHTTTHEVALPLYTLDEARKTFRLFKPLEFNQTHEITQGFSLRYRPAGHILGASSAEITAEGKTILFSGDLGRPNDPIMNPPAPIERADYIVMESTYGDRRHGALDAQAQLGDAIRRTSERGGVVVIPAFAVGRAQEILLAIYRLKISKAIPNLPVFLNSPMAINMTEIYQRHCQEHRLNARECAGLGNVAKMVRTQEQSRALNAVRYPSVIVSASGMATGGRVLHHLKTFAPDHRNTIIFAGFQAGGTRGAKIVSGERTVRIFGEDVPINAEVVSLDGMSAHADSQELMGWLKTAKRAPNTVFLNHGESPAADAMRLEIKHTLGWHAVVPLLGQQFDIN